MRTSRAKSVLATQMLMTMVASLDSLKEVRCCGLLGDWWWLNETLTEVSRVVCCVVRPLTLRHSWMEAEVLATCLTCQTWWTKNDEMTKMKPTIIYRRMRWWSIQCSLATPNGSQRNENLFTQMKKWTIRVLATPIQSQLCVGDTRLTGEKNKIIYNKEKMNDRIIYNKWKWMTTKKFCTGTSVGLLLWKN